MKVLLIGATGNVGLRLCSALLTHGHTVVAYVRSTSKLESALPREAFTQLTVINGDAIDASAIESAILDHSCDAVVNASGLAALAPWGSSTLPAIVSAVLKAAREASEIQKRPLRVWILGGMTALHYPGTQKPLASYLPIFREHVGNLALLKSIPSGTVEWSMLCPMTMVPETENVGFPLKSSRGKLVASRDIPPNFNNSVLKYIPLIGGTLHLMTNASRYETSLEQNAELIAEDLETRDSKFIGAAVGIIDPAR
ncbi:hypothetical protein B0A48_14897 [Cryoendolithus antarcticus]|uniref:NAD(P)-binding domain-containing protein n=1 Tax=Cryoendolithus antarcticus TaxID=1507870 RepID=A0A1V8SIS2_9PEZI|nr:hypothetical protein B0A48_14897 [Cryoendolithus antarcticus]